jgi:hypothetical protein
MKPLHAFEPGAAQAASEEAILLDCYLIIDDSDDFITEIRRIIRERSPRQEVV